jgi:hypothetical protein
MPVALQKFMTKKNLALILVAFVLAVVYVFFFTDWFKPRTIHIFHTSRAFRPQLQRGNTSPTLTFVLNRPCKLTEIKVFPLAELEANPNALPVWHLVSSSNSVPLKLFAYGQNIRGMQPAVPGTHPQPLETNVAYRLFLAAGKIKGRHDFEIGGNPPGATNSASP